jgi:hypothetical protein
MKEQVSSPKIENEMELMSNTENINSGPVSITDIKVEYGSSTGNKTKQQIAVREAERYIQTHALFVLAIFVIFVIL